MVGTRRSTRSAPKKTEPVIPASRAPPRVKKTTATKKAAAAKEELCERNTAQIRQLEREIAHEPNPVKRKSLIQTAEWLIEKTTKMCIAYTSLTGRHLPSNLLYTAKTFLPAGMEAHASASHIPDARAPPPHLLKFTH